MPNRENTIYPNMSFTVSVEDVDLGHLTYRLTEFKTWGSSPAKVTGYTASLIFGQANSDMCDFHLPKISDLDEIIEFLMELKMKWEVANKALIETDNKTINP